jgi:hypothetical protein
MLKGMRTLFILPLAAASLCATAQTATLVCTIDGKPTGTAAFSIVAGPNRSYVQTTIFNITSTITQDKQNDKLESVVSQSFDGMPLEDDEKESLNGVVQRNVSVLFTVRGATVTDKATGKKTPYPLPSGMSMKDISGLWFISVRPRVGDKSSATSFSVQTLAWTKTTRTYVGDETITLDGKKVTGHKLKDEDGATSITTLIDDHGLPLVVDIAQYHFARK